MWKKQILITFKEDTYLAAFGSIEPMHSHANTNIHTLSCFLPCLMSSLLNFND